MPGRAFSAGLAVIGVAGTLSVAAALAAAPANDSPRSAGTFAPFSAAIGKPTESVAVADLFEATADAGVERCLGPSSFKRTVWFRIPEVNAPQQLTVEAVGKTLGVVDLAAFVQPEVAVAPAPTPPPAQPTPPPEPDTGQPVARTAAVGPVAQAAQSENLARPNVCDGAGAGGADASEEPTSAISLYVPQNRPVLVQVGRRSAPISQSDDAAYLNLETLTETNIGQPRGDVAVASTRKLREGDNEVPLAGATTTDEDPATPVCPSLGTVWRRYVPKQTGVELISAFSSDATTLAVFRGRRPTADNVLDCVNRSDRGPMRLLVPVVKRKPYWVRVGADRTFGDESTNVGVEDGTGLLVVDGGEGGADPTRGGPGGGFPAVCNTADAASAEVTGDGPSGAAPAFNRRPRMALELDVDGSPLCDVTLTLKGPKGGTVASGRAIALGEGTRRVVLDRTGELGKGRYRLQITALDLRDRTVKVDTSVSGRLTKR